MSEGKIVFSQIAAMSRNRVIGVKNDLPWHIPEDMKFFRDTTKGKIIIMGRKTFESVGSKPMPHRLNLIVTRQKDFRAEGVHVFTSVEDAVRFAREQAGSKSWPNEIMICGGEEIYRQTLPITNRIYLTIIDKDYEGDAFFPEFDSTKFHLTEKKDRQEPVPFSFCTYEGQLDR